VGKSLRDHPDPGEMVPAQYRTPDVGMINAITSETTGNESLGREMQSGGKPVQWETLLTPERLVKLKMGVG
jgi:hypothetical protein